MLFGLLFLWPLLRPRLPDDDPLAAAVATFGFSLGALSLWLFALALLPGALSFWTGLAGPAAVFVWGLLVWRRGHGAGGRGQAARDEGQGARDKGLGTRGKGQGQTAPPQRADAAPSASKTEPGSPTHNHASRITHHVLRFTHYAPLLALASLAVISVNLLYYPFYYADTLSRYGLFARRIFEAGGLPASVQGYPLLVSLGYAWAFLAAGAVNDRLAGLVSAAFAFGSVGVTFVLGRELYGGRAGLAAAFLAAASTLFVVWATSGYVDIPTGFYFALAALFAHRWLESGRVRDAWLCGCAAGLAIWTKQAGLAILPSLAAVLALAVWQARRRHALLVGLRRPRSALALGRPLGAWDYAREALGGGAIIALAVLLIAGPWYLRNYLLSGPAGVVPLPGDFYLAQGDHRLVALLPFVTRPAEWGWPFALLALAGLLLALGEAAVGERSGPVAAGGRLRPLFVLAFILPYHLAWWRGFSYEARFLLTLLPFYAVLAGRFVDWAVGRLPPPYAQSRPAAFAAGALCLAVAVTGIWPRLGAVYHLAREPLAAEHAIRLRLRPDQTLTVDFLRAHLSPASDSLLVMDGSLEYFLTDYHTGVFYPVTLAEALQWDYVVVPGWAAGLYANLGHAQSEFWLSLDDPARFREVFRAPVEGGSTVYEILR